MTVASATYRNEYTGNGVLAVYPYTFRVLNQSHLKVYIAGVLKILTTDYSVSGIGAAGGGNITFVVPPAAGASVVIVRDVPLTQATDYVENDPFSANTTEDALDKNVMIAQQFREALDRALTFAASSTFKNITVPDLVASRYVRVNAAGTGLELVELTTTGTYVNPITTLGDLLRGGAAGVVERVGIGSAGDVLLVDPTTGKPEWGGGFPVFLTNKTGAPGAAGDVVALDTGNDQAVALADVAGSRKTFVVSLGAPANNATGKYATRGVVVNVKAQGAITRGAYVRKSATTLKVETTGVTMDGFTPIPDGALGVALTAAAGNLVTLYLFGFTWNAPLVLGGATGLIVGNGDGAGAGDLINDLTIAAGCIPSDDATVANRLPLNLTAALTKQLDAAWAAGTNAGGLFTGAIANTTYHLFLIRKDSDGSIDAGYDTSAAGANVPAGYSKKRRIFSFQRIAGAIQLVHQYDDEVLLDTPVQDVVAAPPASTNAILRTLSVPAGVVVRAKVLASWNNGTTNGGVYLSCPDAADVAPSVNLNAAPLASAGIVGVAVTVVSPVDVWTNTAAQIRSRCSGAGVADVMRIVTLGWCDPAMRGRA